MNTPRVCYGVGVPCKKPDDISCRCCEHASIRGWDRSLCSKRCIFDLFPPIVRAVVDLVGACLHVQIGENGAMVIDLNDQRYERMLRAAGVTPSMDLEDLTLHALICFREVVGKEGVMFTNEDIDGADL